MKKRIALTMTSVLLLCPMSTFAAETYIVKSGDNLWDISERKNINFQSLLDVNSQIPNKNLIFPNQVIHLPDTLNKYTVQSGDTLWNIAKKMDVNFLELLNANPQIANKDLIYPGQEINLPKVTVSEKTNSAVPKPKNTTPAVTQPESTTPAVTKPENTTPAVTKPENTTPAVTKPENTTPAVTEPENTTPAVTQPENTTPAVTQPVDNDQAIVNQVVALVNEERAKNGLQPLRNNIALSEVAYNKAIDMANNNYFSHTSPTYGSPFDMMNTFGISYSSAGENIAQGYRTAEAVMTGWMNSTGHRENILNPTFTEIGIGYEKNQHNWVQMFIGN